MSAVFPSPRVARRVSMTDIKAAVARRFNISVSVLESPRRDRAAVRPRQVAMHLASELTDLSQPQIGRELGGRDHTTVLHGLRTIERLRPDDNEIDASIADLRRRLTDPVPEIFPELQLALFHGPLFDFAARMPAAPPPRRRRTPPPPAGGEDDDRWQQRARVGADLLLAAIRSHHPELCR